MWNEKTTTAPGNGTPQELTVNYFFITHTNDQIPQEKNKKLRRAARTYFKYAPIIGGAVGILQLALALVK